MYLIKLQFLNTLDAAFKIYNLPKIKDPSATELNSSCEYSSPIHKCIFHRKLQDYVMICKTIYLCFLNCKIGIMIFILFCKIPNKYLADTVI